MYQRGDQGIGRPKSRPRHHYAWLAHLGARVIGDLCLHGCQGHTSCEFLSSGVGDIGRYFLKVGAFGVGGGLIILACMQDQVVDQSHWLTPQQLPDGLALGRLTPGPSLLLAAFVGYAVGCIFGGSTPYRC